MNLIEKALDFAYNAHKGQTRKDGRTPYVVHPIEVMRLLQECGCENEYTLAVALLHDVLEDTQITQKEMLVEFGEATVQDVVYLSKPYFMSKEQFIASFSSRPQNEANIVMVKAADRICNSRDFLNGGSIRYASEYLSVKGLPILTGLMNIPQKGVFQTCVARELTIRWYQLEDEIDKRLEIISNGT